MYKLHRNRKWVFNMQVYYFFLSMCTLYVCAIWARICSISEAYHQYQWGFLVQVKCIISMNKIWSASKAHHQVQIFGKGRYVMRYIMWKPRKDGIVLNCWTNMSNWVTYDAGVSSRDKLKEEVESWISHRYVCCCDSIDN